MQATYEKRIFQYKFDRTHLLILRGSATMHLLVNLMKTVQVGYRPMLHSKKTFRILEVILSSLGVTNDFHENYQYLFLFLGYSA